MTRFVTMFVLSPLGLALTLALLAGLAAWRGWRRSAWVGATVAVAWLWVWSVPAASSWLGAQAEAGYAVQPLVQVPQAQAAVALGGGTSPPLPGQQYGDLHEAADRAWHAARLYHAGKVRLLVLSGGGLGLPPGTSEAAATRAFLLDLGVPSQAMLLEPASTNTRENARFSAALLQARGIRRVLLVTSALHMSRAVADFKRVGLDVVPVPVDQAPSQPNTQGGQPWWPQDEALVSSGRAFKELAGQLLNKLDYGW